jgi:hypothetical protein
MGDKKKTEKKPSKKKLGLNKETMQELNDKELGDVAGGLGYQLSNGCGAAFSAGRINEPQSCIYCA